MVNKKLLTYGIIAAILIGIAVYSSFVYKETCETFACFQEKMKSCDKVIYLNDEPEATWRYEIPSSSVVGDCTVQVTLLQPKQGELGLERLSGLDMGCTYPRGVSDYPEKSLDLCHGILKEELQGLVIEKLHTYIIDNLGEIDSSLGLLS